MRDLKTIKELLTDQIDLREDVFRIMAAQMSPVYKVAKQIGITETTLRRFLFGNKNLRMVTLFKVQDWMKNKVLE